MRLFNLTVWSPGKMKIKYTEIHSTAQPRNITTIIYLHQTFLHYSKVSIINHFERNNKYQGFLPNSKLTVDIENPVGTDTVY